jgi:hypothetical protein
MKKMSRYAFKRIEILATILIPSLIVCGNSMAVYANPASYSRNKVLENRHACFIILTNESFVNLDGLCGIEDSEESKSIASNLDYSSDSSSINSGLPTSNYRTTKSSKSLGGSVYVKGYFRGGKYVGSYTRSSPSSSGRVSGFGTGRSSSSG